MIHPQRFVWLLVAFALVQCGSQREPFPPARTPTERSAVPAGRTFHVRLHERLSTKSSQVGEAFEAATIASVQAADGTRVARAGATVRGHVVAVNPITSTMRIKFDTIETDGGQEALHATLAPMQQNPGLELSSFGGPGTGYDVAIGPLPPNPALETDGRQVPPSSTVGTANRAPAGIAEPTEIALEVDSGIRLLLTAPLGVRP
jgi:hypothetical protein